MTPQSSVVEPIKLEKVHLVGITNLLSPNSVRMNITWEGPSSFSDLPGEQELSYNIPQMNEPVQSADLHKDPGKATALLLYFFNRHDLSLLHTPKQGPSAE